MALGKWLMVCGGVLAAQSVTLAAAGDDGVVLGISAQGIAFGEQKPTRLAAAIVTPGAAPAAPSHEETAKAAELGALRRRNRQLMQDNAELRARLERAEALNSDLTGDIPADLQLTLKRAQAAERRADDFAALLETAQDRAFELEEKLQVARIAQRDLEAALEEARNRPPPACPEPKPAACPEPKPAACPEPKPTACPEPKPTACPEPECPKLQCPEPAPAVSAEPQAGGAPPPATAARSPRPALQGIASEELKRLRAALDRALSQRWYLTAPAGQPVALDIVEQLAQADPDRALSARQQMVKDYLDWGDEKFRADELDEALVYGERASQVIPGAGERLVALVREEEARRMRHKVAGEPAPERVQPGLEASAPEALPEPGERDLTLKIVDGLRGLFK